MFETERDQFYTPQSYMNLGKAILVSLLDVFDRNPYTRVFNSEYKTLDNLRKPYKFIGDNEAQEGIATLSPVVAFEKCEPNLQTLQFLLFLEILPAEPAVLLPYGGQLAYEFAQLPVLIAQHRQLLITTVSLLQLFGEASLVVECAGLLVACRYNLVVVV
ncbi:unnamed protein product [Sphagnum balticum]